MSQLRKFLDMLHLVSSTQGTNAKVTTITPYMADPNIVTLLNYALSPYITFGVIDFGMAHWVHRAEDTSAQTMYLLEALRTRALTGHAALAALHEHGKILNEDEQRAFRAIVRKELGMGIGITAINKQWPGTIPEFSCQLAPSAMPALHEIAFPTYVEPKWDGVRVIARIDKGIVTLFSRNGIPFENFEEIEDDLLTIAHGHDVVFDGEILSVHGFPAIMKRAKAERGKAADIQCHFAIFDMVPLRDWDAQRCDLILMNRRRLLEDQYGEAIRKAGTLTISRCEIAIDQIEFEKYVEIFRPIAPEGVMIKDPGGLYTFKRNKAWQKFKPFDSADLMVVNVIEGKGKYAGMMGAIACQGVHDDKYIETEVGSGFTDEQRSHIWRNPSDYLGRTVEIKFQEITKAEKSDHYSLRFPTFTRMRTDK